MAVEYETKVLNIDVEAVKQQLKELGAVFVGKKNFRRYVYDMNPPQAEKRMRLRTDGKITTLTIKHIVDGKAIDGVHEREVGVEDFDQMNTLLEQLDYRAKSYQENVRESFILGDCNLEVDSRPLIPAYLEIEWPNKKAVVEVLRKLSVSGEVTSENTTEVYKRYGINIKDYPTLSFS